MKLIYLAEGQNDSRFLKNVLINCNFVAENKIRVFKSNTAKPAKRNEESVVIRSFSEKTSPYQVLIKEENGKEAVLMLMDRVCVNITMTLPSVKLVVVFDHDSINPVEEFRSITNRIKSSRKGIEVHKIFYRNHKDLAHSTVYEIAKRLGKRSTPLIRINFFCFNSSLEASAKSLFGDLDVERLADMISEEFVCSDIFAEL